MPYVQSTKQGSEPVNIYYEDAGSGKPVIFIHGWPLSGLMWEYQVTQLPKKGIRCVTYDRRGFGRSDRPTQNFDYNTLAGDLKAVIDAIGVDGITLVGFSMGGGEIAKYFSLYGGAKISKVVLISAVTPFLLQTDDNPKGVPQKVFNEMLKGMEYDRPGFFESFNKDFFGVGIVSRPVTSAFLSDALTKVMDASPIPTLECAKSFSSTDFRSDVVKINVPTLIIHGDKDKTVPVEPTAEESVKLIKGSKLIVYEGAAHGLWYTEKDRLNEDLVAFI